jgi:hypothetical protein
MGDNGSKEVEQNALVDGFALPDLNRPRGPIPLSLVHNALGIGYDLSGVGFLKANERVR